MFSQWWNWCICSTGEWCLITQKNRHITVKIYYLTVTNQQPSGKMKLPPVNMGRLCHWVGLRAPWQGIPYATHGGGGVWPVHAPASEMDCFPIFRAMKGHIIIHGDIKYHSDSWETTDCLADKEIPYCPYISLLCSWDLTAGPCPEPNELWSTIPYCFNVHCINFLSLAPDFLPSGFQTIIVYGFLIGLKYVTFPAHFIFLDLVILIT